MLFKLRRDVNLVSNVLDVPELFWSEASLKELYDAVREYMEIKGRIQVLNEKLGIASDFVCGLPYLSFRGLFVIVFDSSTPFMTI